MGREINAKKFIPALYRRGYLETLMFAHVNATRLNIPGTSIEEALIQFMKWYGLADEDWDIKTASRTYHRMTKELIQDQKTKPPEE